MPRLPLYFWQILKFWNTEGFCGTGTAKLFFCGTRLGFPGSRDPPCLPTLLCIYTANAIVFHVLIVNGNKTYLKIYIEIYFGKLAGQNGMGPG